MRKIFSLLLAVAVFTVIADSTLAHPLGNFTINHYSRIEPGETRLRIRYVLDYAEIPAFQERQVMDTNGDGQVSETEQNVYLDARVPRLLGNLKLLVNHQPAALSAEKDTIRLEFNPGQGGLQVMRLSMWLQAPFASGNRAEVQYSDENYPERLGWREIVVAPGSGIGIQNSNTASLDTSRELTVYPENLLNNPRNDRAAEFTVVPGGASGDMPANGSTVSTGALGALDRTREEFGKLLTTNQELTPLVLLISFFVAMGLGALHAFSPGHGKAVVGAYLVGSRGNWQHALFLGLVVTATHTAGVYALGFVTLFLAAYIVPEQLFPWMGAISGLLVAIIGVRLFIERLRAARGQTTSYDKAMANMHAHDKSEAQSHVHSPNHTHEHHPAAELTPAFAFAGNASTVPTPGSVFTTQTHSHDFATPEQEAAHAREHLAGIQAFEKPSWKNLLSLGISGGLLPCPSALVVMLSAIALGRVLYGLFLIVGFSLGLASVLVGTGLALLYAGRFAGKYLAGNRVGTFMRYVPIIGAFLVAVLGIGIALDAFLQTGFVP